MLYRLIVPSRGRSKSAKRIRVVRIGAHPDK